MPEKLRLDKTEKDALKKALERVKGRVFLFGSRIDPKKRGGDIDLLIYSRKDSSDLSRRVRMTFFENCEEKIDVLVVNPQKMTPAQQAFVNSIRRIRVK